MTPLLLVAGLFVAQPPAEGEATVPEKVERAALATVRVTNLGISDFKIASGVTVGVQNGFAYVLTANHALGQDGDRKVEFFTDLTGDPDPAFKTLPTDVHVDARFPPADIAILKVALRDESPPGKTDPAAPASSPPAKKTGPPTPPVARLAPPFERPRRFPTPVYAVGLNNPKEGGKPEPPTVIAANLIGKKLRRSGSDVAILWETDKPHEVGRSGGPLLDKDGRVIGVCLANDTGTNHGLFTHLDEIQAWMKKNGYAWVFEDK